MKSSWYNKLKSNFNHHTGQQKENLQFWLSDLIVNLVALDKYVNAQQKKQYFATTKKISIPN